MVSYRRKYKAKQNSTLKIPITGYFPNGTISQTVRDSDMDYRGIKSSVSEFLVIFAPFKRIVVEKVIDCSTISYTIYLNQMVPLEIYIENGRYIK